MMKRTSITLFLLLWAGSAVATYWEGGVHTVGDGETHGESALDNNGTLSVMGGYIQSLQCFDTSQLVMTGGHIDNLDIQAESTADLREGSIDIIQVNLPSGIGPAISLYVADYTLQTDHTLNYDLLTGTWLDTNDEFSILIRETATPYLQFIPEPNICILLVLGAFLRTRHHISNNA